MNGIARAAMLMPVLVAAFAVSCSSERRPTLEVEPATGAPIAPSAPAFDVGTLAKRSHFAFRDDGRAFTGGHATHAASVAHDGTIRFAPRRPASGELARKHPHRIVGEPALTLATLSLRRGEEIAMRSPTTRIADGDVVIDRGATVERLENTESGLEQSWKIAERPSGAGALELRVHVSTTAIGEAAPGGARFVDRVTGHAVSYGHAAWVDARGTRTSLEVRLEGRDTLVMTVPGGVVDGSAYPAVLDPTISPELAMDDAVVTPVGFRSYEVGVAGGKNGSFLVTWSDERIVSIDSNLFFGSQQVFGARVSAAGALLDPTGIVIAPTRDFDIDQVHASFDGQGWFVVWNQYPYNADCTQLAGARVSETGTVLDPISIPLVCASTFNTGFDGARYLVAFSGKSLTVPGGSAVLGKYVTAAGVVDTPIPFTIVEGNVAPTPLVCDRATECMLVRATGSGLRGTRIPKSGIIAPVEVPVSGSAADGSPRASFDGTNFIVGWSSAGSTYAGRIVPGTGAVLDPSGIVIANKAFYDVGSISTESLFLFQTASQLQGVRLSNVGTVLDAVPQQLTTSALASSPVVVAGAGSGFLAAWKDNRGGGYGTLYAGRVSAAGLPLDGDGFNVRRGAASETNPVVAGDASGYLAIWQDLSSGDYRSRLRGARLAGDGTPASGAGFDVSPKGNSPSVAYDGTGFLATWVDVTFNENEYGGSYGPIVAARISKAGVVSPSIPLGVGSGASPHVVFDGTNYLVGWLSTTTQLTRITPAGVVLDATPIVVMNKGGGFGGGIAMASSGQETLVTVAGGQSNSVYSARVSKAGTVLDTPPIKVTDAVFETWNPAAAWDGKQYVVAWQDYRTTYYVDADIYAARVTQSGTVLDPGGAPIATGSSNQIMPRVIGMGDGVTTLIAWSDSRRTDRYRDFDIYGAFMRSADGTVLDPTGIPLSSGDGNELAATFAPKAPGTVLLAYYRVDPTPGAGVQRVRGRFVTSGALLAKACSADSECASRACTDGICCETPCKGACQTCSAVPGKCTAVVSAEDPDSCALGRICDATSTCRTNLGQQCASGADCASDACSEGVCCDRACNGACETCSSPIGHCTPRRARAVGAPTCAPFACDGANATCPSSCTTDSACPGGARCDVTTGLCVVGGYCVDSRTVGGLAPEPTSCAPYTCESSACRTTCRDVHDCAFPSVCNEAGTCVSAPSAATASASGCSISPAHASQDDAPVRHGGLAVVLGAALALVARRRRR